MFPDDDVALPGGEQTHAPVTPAPAEPAPHETARQTVRKAFEEAQARAAEKDEARRTPGEKTGSEPRAPAATDSSEPLSDPSKPTLDRTRDQQGRFVKGEGQEQPPGEKPAQEAPAAPQTQEEPAGAVALRPPPGWSAAARAMYASLPPEIKEAVAKREGEIATGMQAIQHYRGLETYTPMIEGSGISHAEFTKRAVEWEQSLKTNPVGTVLHVAKLGNVDIVRLAQQIMQQAGQQGYQSAPPANARQAVQQSYQDAQAQPDIEALLERKLAEREAHETVDDFLSDPANIHAEAVSDDMALLITNGRADNLRQAYEMACWAHPEIRALLIREASANPAAVSETERARRRASEAKAAAKATVGAPSGPRPEQKDTRPPNATVRYDVRRAYEQVRDRDL
jgi:hypothetical protein